MLIPCNHVTLPGMLLAERAASVGKAVPQVMGTVVPCTLSTALCC